MRSLITAPVAARMPRAIGRSNEAPSFRRSAGARFTVMRSDGNGKPGLRIAVRTRSRLSRTAESGSPTVVSVGAISGSGLHPDCAGNRSRNEAVSVRERPAELAADLVRLKVDIIIASTPGVRAAQRATTSIPIIMCVADDAVKQGFVSNPARPRGNITGMAAFASELAGNGLEFLGEATGGGGG